MAKIFFIISALVLSVMALAEEVATNTKYSDKPEVPLTLIEIEALKGSELVNKELKVLKRDAMNLNSYDRNSKMAYARDKNCSIAVAPVKFPYEVQNRGATWKVNQYIAPPKFLFGDCRSHDDCGPDGKPKLRLECENMPIFGPFQREIQRNCIDARNGYASSYQPSFDLLHLTSGQVPHQKEMWVYAHSDRELVTCLKNYGFRVRLPTKTTPEQMAEGTH